MSNNDAIRSFQESEPRSTGETKRSRSRRIPKSWIIAAILFYCASVVTVGLLAGLLPRRTQHINILATATPSMTTAPDPSKCIDDECEPRLSSDLIVDSYELEYMYNNTNQTTVQGKVTIEFTLKQPIKQLIYHSKGMLELEVPEIYENGACRSVLMRLYPLNDYISLLRTTNTLFAANNYKLVQKFNVNLTDGNVGFYQNVFKDGNETTQ
jgi:hypothetical protein